MGELARLAIEKLTKEGLILGGKGSDLLSTRARFYTKYVSEIESEPPGTYANCKEILEELGESFALLINLYFTIPPVVYTAITNSLAAFDSFILSLSLLLAEMLCIFSIYPLFINYCCKM